MNKTTLYALLFGAAIVPTSAYAGGFQLSEYSSSAIAHAFAGTGISGDDYSAVAYNPAAMTLKETGMQGTATYFNLRGHAYNLDNPGQKDGLLSTKVTVPAFFAQYKINDTWHIGAGVYVPFGLGTNWKGRWFGDYEAMDSIIEDVNYNLSVAYKATDKLSLGLSVIADAMHAELTNYAAHYTVSQTYSMMEADAFNVLWQAGLMYEFSKNTRFGLAYRPKSAQDLHGDHDITNGMNGRVHTRLTLPEYFNASVYHKLNDSFALMAGARWTRWNRFKTLDIWSTAGGPDHSTGAVDEGWKNVWMLSLGADWYVNDQWTLRGGVAWDESPIRDSNHRTARIPDSSRIILSLGAGYKTGNWTWDAAYSHLIMQKHDGYRPAGGAAKPAFNYRRELNTDMISLGVQYNF